MRKCKFLTLIMSIVLAVAVSFSIAPTFANQTNVLEDGNNAYISSVEGVFDDASVLTVTDALGNGDNVSALLYHSAIVYQKIEYGFNVKVTLNDEEIKSVPESVEFYIPSSLEAQADVVVAVINNDYIVNLAIDASSRLLNREINDDDNKKIVESFLNSADGDKNA